MSKKIAIIIERSNIVLGGAERSVFELSLAFSALGARVDILSAKGQTNAKNIHILCPHTSGKRTSYSTFANALKTHLAQNQYDIIHSVLPFDFADVYQPRGGSFTEATLRNAASYQSKPLVYWKKITAFANFRRTNFLRAEKKLCRKPDGPIVAAISRYVARQFNQYYNLPEDRIVVIPNGVKVNKPVDIAEADRLRGHILANLRLKEADEPVFFLFAANNFRLKGLHCLIRAMQLAIARSSQRPPFLIVAGNGKIRKYRHLAKKLRVHKNIVFSGSIRNIQNALSIVDAVVLPTYYDPASRVILEALAADKPVITTKFNGATDLFTADRHGKIIDTPENIDQLAAAIAHFTDIENIRKATSAIIADNIKEEISINRAAKQLDTLYDSILRKRGR